jgi:hypothetical protein
MSRLRNRREISQWIWEWGHDMDGWPEVLCELPFDSVNYFPEIDPLHDWLADDGYKGDYFVRPHGLTSDGVNCYVFFLFENPEAAFNFKMRWG